MLSLLFRNSRTIGKLIIVGYALFLVFVLMQSIEKTRAKESLTLAPITQSTGACSPPADRPGRAAPYVGIDLTVIVDMSGSMCGKDCGYANLTANDPEAGRFELASAMIDTLFTWRRAFAPNKPDHPTEPGITINLSSVYFGSTVNIVQPWVEVANPSSRSLDVDRRVLKELLSKNNNTKKELGATNMYGAFEKARDLMNAAPPPQKVGAKHLRVVMVLTDGQPCFVGACTDAGDQFDKMIELSDRYFSAPDYELYSIIFDDNSDTRRRTSTDSVVGPRSSWESTGKPKWERIVHGRDNVRLRYGGTFNPRYRLAGNTGEALTYSNEAINDILARVRPSSLYVPIRVDGTGRSNFFMLPFLQKARFAIIKRTVATTRSLKIKYPDGVESDFTRESPPLEGVTIEGGGTDLTETYTFNFPKPGNYQVTVVNSDIAVSVSATLLPIRPILVSTLSASALSDVKINVKLVGDSSLGIEDYPEPDYAIAVKAIITPVGVAGASPITLNLKRDTAAGLGIYSNAGLPPLALPSAGRYRVTLRGELTPKMVEVGKKLCLNIEPLFDTVSLPPSYLEVTPTAIEMIGNPSIPPSSYEVAPVKVVRNTNSPTLHPAVQQSGGDSGWLEGRTKRLWIRLFNPNNGSPVTVSSQFKYFVGLVPAGTPIQSGVKPSYLNGTVSEFKPDNRPGVLVGEIAASLPGDFDQVGHGELQELGKAEPSILLVQKFETIKVRPQLKVNAKLSFRENCTIGKIMIASTTLLGQDSGCGTFFDSFFSDDQAIVILSVADQFGNPVDLQTAPKLVIEGGPNESVTTYEVIKTGEYAYRVPSRMVLILYGNYTFKASLDPSMLKPGDYVVGQTSGIVKGAISVIPIEFMGLIGVFIIGAVLATGGLVWAWNWKDVVAPVGNMILQMEAPNPNRRGNSTTLDLITIPLNRRANSYTIPVPKVVKKAFPRLKSITIENVKGNTLEETKQKTRIDGEVRLIFKFSKDDKLPMIPDKLIHLMPKQGVNQVDVWTNNVSGHANENDTLLVTKDS